MLPGLVISILITFIFVVSGQLLQHKPPQEINGFIGYRTPRSMKNIALWKEGNAYSSRIMIKLGYIIGLIGGILSLTLGRKFEIQTVIAVAGLMLISIILMFVLVEKRLKELDH